VTLALRKQERSPGIDKTDPRAVAQAVGLKHDRMKESYSLREAAEELGLAVTGGLYEAIKRKRLEATAIRIGKRTFYQIAKDDLLIWAISRERGPVNRHPKTGLPLVVKKRRP
jgi:hypothetical protein